MASPAFQTSGSNSNAASTTYSGTIPASVVAGDLLIAAVQPKVNLTTQAAMTTVPANWNWIRNDGSGSWSSFLYWKPAVGGDAGTSINWGSASSAISYVTIARITGHNSASPIDAHNGTNDASQSAHLCPGVTTLTVDTLILVLASAGSGTTATVVSPLVEQWDASTGGGTVKWTYGASQPQAATGATGTFTVTTTSAPAACTLQTLAIASLSAATSLVIPTETAYTILSRR